MMSTPCTTELEDLLYNLENAGVISKFETKMQAQLCPHEKLEVCIWFTIPSGLSIKKFRKFKSAMLTRFPYLKIKKIYNKHMVMLYYQYERS